MFTHAEHGGASRTSRSQYQNALACQVDHTCDWIDDAGHVCVEAGQYSVAVHAAECCRRPSAPTVLSR